ncbi:hypothetical protein V2J09_021679 [Rumex salicifolius]
MSVDGMIAGGTAGVVVETALYPIDTIKTRLQAVRGGGQIVWKGLYSGLAGNIAVTDSGLPYSLQSAGALGGMAASLIRVPTEAKRDLSDPENAVIGAFAGAMTGAITTPLDVIKTRLMVQGSANQYKGIMDCVSTIVREEGPRSLLKGIGPRVLWIGIGGSIFFGVLERTKRLLSQRHPLHNQDTETKQD